MAVATVATDTWLSHLEFVGQRRQTDFGPIDGLFYGVVSTTGDASGGNVSLNGNVSEERKEDWVYIIQRASFSRTGVSGAGFGGFMVAATGPVIPTPTAVQNASFHIGGDLFGVTNNDVSTLALSQGPEAIFKDLPIFGDKRIAGPLQMLACGLEENINGAVYQMSVYGWLIRYAGFFRNVRGDLG